MLEALDALEREASWLAESIAEGVASARDDRSPGDAWLDVVGERVLPLSLCVAPAASGRSSDTARRLAALERSAIRLQREAQSLAEMTQRAIQLAERLRADRRRLRERHEQICSRLTATHPRSP